MYSNKKELPKKLTNENGTFNNYIQNLINKYLHFIEIEA